MMRYRNPSIIEALCEFTYKPDTPWDPTVFGLFYERMKTELPHREQGEVLETAFQMTRDHMGHQVRRSPRMLFLSEDRTCLTQLAQHLLVVNVLAPYPHWDEFKRLIFRAAAVYNEVARPSGLAKTLLRYIDRFEFDASGFKLGVWFNCSGEFLPPILADQSTAAMYRTRVPCAGGGDFGLSLGVRPSDDNRQRIATLDTEVSNPGIAEASKAAEPSLDRMHDFIVDAFERCLTDKLRTKLVPEGDAEGRT